MLNKFLSKLSFWYFSKNALPYWGILLVDCVTVVGAEMFVFALNNGLLFTLHNWWHLLFTFVCYLPLYILGFRLLHTYSGVIRYSSFVDLQRVGFAMAIGCVLTILVQLFLPKGGWLMDVCICDLLLGALLATSMMWFVRVMVKYMFDVTNWRQAKPVFIYGVKAGGIGLAKNIRNQESSRYMVAGFVADEQDVKERYMLGVKVYLEDEHLVEEMKKRGVKTLVVSPMKSEDLRNNQDMVGRLLDAGIKIMVVPRAQEWDGHSDLNAMSLKEVAIEDLLPRDKIEIDLKTVGDLLQGKKILITGAAGSIGSEMVRQVAKFGPKDLLLIDQAETPLHDIRLMMAQEWPNIQAYTIVADICMQQRMEELFKAHRPDYVFHAAAYKHVPMMEDNPGESIRNNVWGTRVIADLAVKYGTKKFVMVSTDKAVNPTNVMGCSKRICEIYVQSLDKAIKDGRIEGKTQFVTTRFGNVLGSNGSVIPLFKQQIKQGGPITVTHRDIIRYFMLIPEACKLVLEAGTMGNGGEIYVFDMGKPVKIVDLAQRMIQLSDAKNIEIKFTGLRDGEKLYEEVLNEEETTKPTYHPKIKIANVREYNYEDVLQQIDELVAASYEEDMQIVKLMKAMVPEFKSQHSKYEQLDRN